MKLKIENILIAFLFFAVHLTAQQFEASVDKTNVGQNERFQVYFTFSNADINKAGGFKPPAFDGFRLLSGPNQSTSMQIINGKVSGSLTYSYILQSQEMGDFVIQSASVNYEGRTYKTDPLKIRVTKASGNVNSGSTDGGISNEDLEKNVFIIASADKQNVYQGEQITVTYKLYTRLNISSPQISKLPTYNGFWVEELETSNNINFNIEMYEGQRFRSAVIKKAALFPTKSGELTITPFELNVPVLIRKQRTSRDIFDDFFNDSFFGRTETVEFLAKSNQLKINAKPLPENGKPESFNGAVGDFDFNANISGNNVETNESITMKLSVKGNGNIKLLDLPKIDVPAGFEKFDPKVSENISRKGRVSGSKETEYLIVPRIPGSKEIPIIEFSYFDPVKKQYFTKSAGPFEIEVAKGAGTIETSSSGFSKEDIKLLSQDIRFIKTSSFDLKRKRDYETIPNWFWFSIISPLLLFAVIIGLKRRQDKLQGNVQLLRYRKAEKLAKARLKSSKKALDSGDVNYFYTELSSALYGYLEDKLNIQKADFTVERALTKLSSLSISNQLIESVAKISERCEFARFAPKTDGNQEALTFYNEAVDTIVNLENSIPKKKK